LSTRKMAKSGQISSQTPHPTHNELSVIRGGCIPIWLSFFDSSNTFRGQNVMQKLHPLHLSSIRMMSTSLSFRYACGERGRREGLVGVHLLTNSVVGVPAVACSVTCWTMLPTGRASLVCVFSIYSKYRDSSLSKYYAY
jgi:hypothetical protein